MNTGEHTPTRPVMKALRRVVVVNGNPDVLDLLESALDGGRYDLSFADAGQHAYSLIKRELPDLVVLTVHIEALDGFQLLSMLKLDPATRDIPVVTLTAEVDTEEEAEDDTLDNDLALPTVPPLRLH